jgi:hypothetical protein
MRFLKGRNSANGARDRHERHVVMGKVKVGAVHVIGEEGAAGASLRPAGAKHEVIDHELAAAAEEIREGLSSLRRVEDIGLLDLHPG